MNDNNNNNNTNTNTNTIKVEVGVEEALHDYFKMKAVYESQNTANKKKISKGGNEH